MKTLTKQNEGQQEVLDDVQKKSINLLSSTEGKVHRILMRNLFMGYVQIPTRHQVLPSVENTLEYQKQRSEAVVQ